MFEQFCSRNNSTNVAEIASLAQCGPPTFHARCCLGWVRQSHVNILQNAQGTVIATPSFDRNSISSALRCKQHSVQLGNAKSCLTEVNTCGTSDFVMQFSAVSQLHGPAEEGGRADGGRACQVVVIHVPWSPSRERQKTSFSSAS